MLFLHNFRFVAHFSYSNYTIKLVNISTATLDYMRKVRTVFCPDETLNNKTVYVKTRNKVICRLKLRFHISCDLSRLP